MYEYSIGITKTEENFNSGGPWFSGAHNFYVNVESPEMSRFDFSIETIGTVGEPREFTIDNDFDNFSYPFGCVVRLSTPGEMDWMMDCKDGNKQLFWTHFGGYGTYELSATAGDTVFAKETITYPKHPSEIYVRSLPDNVIRDQSLDFSIIVRDADPNNRNLTYRILDPNGSVVFSETREFEYVSKGGCPGINCVFYNAIGLEWGLYANIDTSNFPDIDGSYTIEMDYEDSVIRDSNWDITTPSFYFDSYSSEFLVDKVVGKFTRTAYLPDEQQLREEFGDDRFDKFMRISTEYTESFNMVTEKNFVIQ